MAQWIHMPEISINVGNVRWITAGPKGILKLHYAPKEFIEVEGDKAKAVLQAIARQAPFEGQVEMGK